MTTDFPTGTVTFLFTDIEGSTQLWERHPQAMQAALARHDALLAQAVTRRGGAIVKNTGDGCHAVFATAINGALATLDAQQALQAEPWPDIQPDPLRVRMALHTGEAETRDGDYYGPALNRAARLMAAGHGGQVLLSQMAAGLVRDQLPPGALLRDLGEHRLKDLTHPEHIFQLIGPGLPADFPALRTLDVAAHNLPIQRTHFIGRERELEEVERLLGETWLLTLTGSGGTGKTRLSLQAAAQALDSFPDGAWLVELAPIADPALVEQTVATVLNVRQPPGRSLFDGLTDFLRGKQLLLILDNCEHLIAACAGLAERLLRQCARLKILVSSREALGIQGETTYPVPSLTLPGSQSGTSAVGLAQSEAVRLFVDRATAAQPSFALTDENAQAVAVICRRLDGIPLAIELAVARVRLLGVHQIAARLDDRFRLLTGGSRTALPRQQTLRALVDWSYALLSEPERACLQRLSVFAGGWTLEAAEAVCVRDAQSQVAGSSSEPMDVLELLSQLANKSLVVVDDPAQAGTDGGDETRYRLLETIRQYAREKLFDAQHGNPAVWREWHMRYFLGYAVQAQAGMDGPRLVYWLDRLARDHDNFRAAMEWALEKDTLAAMQLAEALSFYLARRGYFGEGLYWLNESVARGRAAAPADGPAARDFQLALARALCARAMFDFGFASIGAEARGAAEESVRLARQAGDRQTLARSLAVLGMTEGFWGALDRGCQAGQEALALALESNDLIATIMAYSALTISDHKESVQRGEITQFMRESVRLARQSGNPWRVAWATLNMARELAVTGDLAEVRARFEECIRIFRELGDLNRMNGSRSDLAHALRRHGHIDEALALYNETLREWQRLGSRAAVAHQLENLAFIAIARAQPPRAARLLGQAQALRLASSALMMPPERAEYEQALASLREQLPEPEQQPDWAAGRAMPMDEAIDYALEDEETA